MSWRNVIISRRCKLDYKMGYLVVRSDEIQRIYLDEVAVLMLENPAVSLTGCLMEALMQKKIKVIFCDAKRSPIAEVVPYHGSHNSSHRLKKQIEWTDETKGQVWQSIIREKIAKQAGFLKELRHDREYAMLTQYGCEVEPHDATNREGHAAKVYFNALFGMDFSRGLDSPVNAALDYGYCLLLSAFNREVALNGCLTQLGVFHDNMFNHFNLSCDLMEPFRILIDRMVVEMAPEQFAKDEKHALWRVFSQTVQYAGSKQLVSAAIRLYTRNVIDCLNTASPEKVIHYQEI